ncbi:MAG: ATP-binding protein [Edaphobacter sp.]
MSASTGLPANALIHTPQSLPEMRVNAHAVHFYEEDAFLLDSLSQLIGTALVTGDTAVIVATAAHREGLEKRLKARGLDPVRIAKLGRYCTLDAAETLSAFMVNNLPDASLFNAFTTHFLSSVRSAAKSGSQRLILFGEMVALLWSEGKFEAALKLEQLWSDLARTHAFDLHCAYPIKDFNREGHSQAFLNICAEHSHVVPTENYTALTSEDDRLRHISLLQQRAQTAEAEAAGRLRAEEALRKSEKLAASGRLAASIAHEINNPLEAISNAIYLARSASSQQDVATYLKIADEELVRVAEIAKHTLGFYRETASPGIVKVSSLLDDILNLYSRKLQGKGLTIKKQYRSELEVWGLEGELRQVFANQIANAIYAMPKNGCLTIRIRRSKAWGNNQRSGTAVSLIDTGSGISSESLSKIFDPFFTTKQDVGNGLGLWITHDIVTRHRGSIRVRSNTRSGASGTIFTTFLPRHNGDTPAIF